MVAMNLLKKLTGCAALVVVLALAGCETTPSHGFGGGAPPPQVTGTTFNVGDLVVVAFSGVDVVPPPHEERVKEDGTVTLSDIGAVVARGKTPGQLQKDIRSGYVPRFYSESLNVTVRSMDRFYFVGGEVRSPNRYLWAEGMTLLRAIKTAGDFTDFANKRKVQVARMDGRTIVVNCDKAKKNPELDVLIYPGDNIDVPRRLF